MIRTSERTWERISLTSAEAGRHQAMPARPLPSCDPALLQKAHAHCESVIAEHGKQPPEARHSKKRQALWVHHYG